VSTTGGAVQCRGMAVRDRLDLVRLGLGPRLCPTCLLQEWSGMLLRKGEAVSVASAAVLGFPCKLQGVRLFQGYGSCLNMPGARMRGLVDKLLV
jgi:hypothetical protein